MSKENEYIKVMEAFRDGKEIESRQIWRTSDGKEWKKNSNPLWDFYSTEYRVKPEEPLKFGDRVTGKSYFNGYIEGIYLWPAVDNEHVQRVAVAELNGIVCATDCKRVKP
jgi:hypothetical protein